MTAQARYGTGSHTADLVFWVQADTLEQLFASAACGLAELMVAGPRDGELTWLPLELQASDQAELLVELLNEVIYLLDGEGLLCVALEVRELDPTRLQARLGVIPWDPKRHQIREPVKAATYHQAEVAPHGQGWRAQVVLDV